jgi:histidinol-phosphate phosphatase family protein
LDRDGTINVERTDYVKSPAEFHFLPGAVAALRGLASMEVEIIVVTNQSAIGRGIMTRTMANEINRRMVDEIAASGGRISQVYLCPHAPSDGCACRKPRPGLLLQAARKHGLDLYRSFMVGDSASDVEAALAVGCRPMLICGDEHQVTSLSEAAVRVADLRQAVRQIQRDIKVLASLRA